MITCDQGSHFVHPISVVPDEDGGGHVDGQGSLATQVAHLPAQPLHLGLGVTRHLLCHDSKRPVQNQQNDHQNCIMTRFGAFRWDANGDNVCLSKDCSVHVNPTGLGLSVCVMLLLHACAGSEILKL